MFKHINLSLTNKQMPYNIIKTKNFKDHLKKKLLLKIKYVLQIYVYIYRYMCLFSVFYISLPVS